MVLETVKDVGGTVLEAELSVFDRVDDSVVIAAVVARGVRVLVRFLSGTVQLHSTLCSMVRQSYGLLSLAVWTESRTAARMRCRRQRLQ